MYRLLAVLATVGRRRAARSPLLCIEVHLETEHRLSQSVSADAGSVATAAPTFAGATGDFRSREGEPRNDTRMDICGSLAGGLRNAYRKYSGDGHPVDSVS